MPNKIDNAEKQETDWYEKLYIQWKIENFENISEIAPIKLYFNLKIPSPSVF